MASTRQQGFIVLFTDFGVSGPYLGQMKAVLYRQAPGLPVIDLFCDAPACDPYLGAYLLAAYTAEFPAGTVFLGVVDPGVGTSRAPILVKADGKWFVGPDNGLFELVIRRAGSAEIWDTDWRPARLSASFHGRDLFAPVAAALAMGRMPAALAMGRLPAARKRPDGAARIGQDWPDDLDRIVYIDAFGNAMTGLRAAALPPGTVLEAAGRKFYCYRTFADVPPGEALWYENSNGLAEIAVNRGRADRLGIGVGATVGYREGLA